MNEIDRPDHGRIDSRRITGFADSLASSLDRQMKHAYRPEGQKKQRLFSARELTDLTGISASNLRLRHNEDPEFPPFESDARGHRWYTAETMDRIRDHMFRTAKNGEAFRPGRREGDSLQVISTVNFKGGSGKSTTAVHLAQRYALRGYRVLAIDMDPQGSLTTMFGYRPELEFSEHGTVYDALRYDELQVPISQVIRKTYFHNLDLAPGGLALAEYETTTAYALTRKIVPSFAQRLTFQLDEVEKNYDLVIIDCPPQLGFITLSAIAASTGLIVTVVPSMFDVASMSQFLKLAGELFETIEQLTNRPVSWDFLKFLLTRYEPSDAPQTQMAAYLRSILAGHVLTEPMLKSTAISDAGITQQTIYEVEPGDFVKKTLERAVTSMNAVGDEIEQLIQNSWGRN
ncbi:plasmid partitioning protein RepA [Pseudogemmobacter bohemicus]|uniref:plasmid partitioning protein RepA n=1 Tax=Pseudogemmobacter bohemicus TaxID=2250708 RepID=UPI000DD4E6C7|nr:plasmid partitioning protein RepA [Pseudogemmobacter bohemicus]